MLTVRRLRLVKAMSLVLLLLLALMAMVGCLFNGPAYRGPKTAHFDGEKFFNDPPVPEKNIWDVWRWKRSRPDPPVPPSLSIVTSVPVQRVQDSAIVATWVGHATVLLQSGGVNVLTDPVWAERASPVTFAGPRRFAAPGVRFSDLPPIDVVLLTHNHYDHCDLDTLERLHREHGARIVVPLGLDLLLAKKDIPSVAVLDWWQETTVAGVRVSAVPARHFSARGLSDRNRTLWCGFVADFPGGARVYMAGDTGWGDHFHEIGRRFPGIGLALIPVGAYLPRYFMEHAHIDPAEAVQALSVVGAHAGLGIHWNTFPMADDRPDDTQTALKEALRVRGEGPPLRLLPHGASWRIEAHR